MQTATLLERLQNENGAVTKRTETERKLFIIATVYIYIYTVQDEILARSKLWRLVIFSVIRQYLI